MTLLFHRVLPAFLVTAVVVCVVSSYGAAAQDTQPPIPAGLTKYEFGTPNGDEVEMLELINRARSNPAAEGQRLVDALNVIYPNGGSGVDLAQTLSDFAGFPNRPPLAFNANLNAAAEAHLADNFRLGTQSHDSPDGTTPNIRVQQFGYHSFGGENCNGTKGYNALVTPWMIHGTYELADPGHRGNILEDGEALGKVEFGTGLMPTGGWNVEDFGRNLTPPLLTGVVFNDNAATGFFATGEGVNGVVVTCDLSSFYALTVNGAYALPLDLTPRYDAAQPPPTANVTFTASDGTVFKQSVILGHTVTAITEYLDWNQQTGEVWTRYDNGKADWVLPASVVTTPDPTPTPAPVAQAAVTITPASDGAGFVVDRSGDTSSTLVVAYKVKGTAVAGRDYDPLPGTRKIKANKSQARIKATMLPGATGSLKLILVGTDAYSTASPSQAKVRLLGSP